MLSKIVIGLTNFSKFDDVSWIRIDDILRGRLDPKKSLYIILDINKKTNATKIYIFSNYFYLSDS